ncbi:MAG: putative LPS assembly protein LptD [Syntrophobacterales bacterium]
MWVILSLGAGSVWAGEVPLFPKQSFAGGPWRLRASQVVYDAPTRTYTAEGRVEIVQGDRRLTAEWAQVQENTKIVRLKGNVVLVLEGDIFSGQEGSFNLVTRSGEMRGARLFLHRNHFRLDSALIRKTVGGVPVFFTPFLTLPALTKRQSGLLLPNVELSKASGTVLEFPVYWAISNHADATFCQNYLSKRGYMQGVDLRYRGRRHAAGDLRFV